MFQLHVCYVLLNVPPPPPLQYKTKGRSEADTMIAGPMVELLNYCTGISFEGFASADSEG